MSLNLGTEGVNACANLGQQGDFVALRLALLEQVRTQVNQALDIDPVKREDAVGYARALRDVWIAMEAAATGKKYQEIKKPLPSTVSSGNVR